MPLVAASTLISSLIAQARVHLNEETPAFWSDAELLNHATNATKDLWRKINGQYQDYFVTIDDTDVTLAATTAQFSGVPPDCFRPLMIEPRVVGSSNPNQGLIFKPRRYNHPDFVQARAADPVEPQATIIFYAMMNPGAPYNPPLILVAPQVTAAVNIRLAYTQCLPARTNGDGTANLTDFNAIPGESDSAIIAWIVAWARAKELDNRSPDPNWLAVYNTEKSNLVEELSIPRSEQEQEVVEAMFQDMWPDWQ